MSAVRTRFAPSPTGRLHLGNAHTALYCWLYARRHKGQFVLRIEDTDIERSTKENVQVILDGLTWLGLDWDEGPIFQTERMDVYKEAIEKCIANGWAYRCTCKAEDLEEKRQKAKEEKRTYIYDGTCREKNHGPDCGPHVIRFKMPQEGFSEFTDRIKGTVRFPNNELNDWIISRTDGTPTYNFCVVLDDAQMKISHVIRGDDHLNNTFKQLYVYKALGYELPEFAHMPLIHGKDGGKLKKRHGATSVVDYRDLGFLPVAMRNYLARLGWGHGDQEIFTDEEMISLFDIDDVGKSPSIFDMEKFLWINAQHMRAMPHDVVAGLVLPFLKEKGFEVEQGPMLTKLVDNYIERSSTLKEMAEMCFYIFAEDVEYQEKDAKKHLRPVALEPLKAIREALDSVDPWQDENIHEAFDQVCGKLELKLGKIAQPVRVAVTGQSFSPGINETLTLIGKERTLKRIDRGIRYIEERIDQAD